MDNMDKILELIEGRGVKINWDKDWSPTEQ